MAQVHKYRLDELACRRLHELEYRGAVKYDCETDLLMGKTVDQNVDVCQNIESTSTNPSARIANGENRISEIIHKPASDPAPGNDEI